MRVLFLSQRVPYPPNRGDKITTWRLIERMRRSHEVRVVAFAHDDEDRHAAEHLRGLGIPTVAIPIDLRRQKLRALPLLFGTRPLTLGVYGSSDLQHAVDELAPSCDVGYAYSSSMGAFLERHTRLRRVMHFAELDSDKWRQYAERSRWPMSAIYAREHRTLREFERRIAHSFDESVLCTPLEQEVFEREISGAHSIVMRNGVDLAFYRPQPERAEPGHLVFVGVMDYLPNIDGCTWFVREILPQLRARFPSARLSIVGSRPTPEVLALAREPGVTVTGFVEDPREWLARASVSVAPLRIARGIQNKVLEALAMGLPVVGTTSATQGVEGEQGRDFLLANTVDEQVAAVARLIEDPQLARRLGAQGRAFVESRYDWDVALQPLDELLARFSSR